MHYTKKGLVGLSAILLLAGWGCNKKTDVNVNLSDTPEQKPNNEQPTVEKNVSNETKTEPTVDVKVNAKVKTDIKTAVEVNALSIKLFTITAKNWEFSPSTIKVKKGDTVRLTIKSVDVDHGFKLVDFNVNQPLKPGQTATVEFIADKSGSFSFTCNVFCGPGHKDMRGTLIVE